MFVNDNFMISIVIATYNSELTLRRAMQSVLNLTYQDWECIVVDGASKDGTLDIVKEFVDRDARFRYISEPDNGIYDAFNKGWKMAKGEWVMYLGSDDEYISDGVQILMNNAQNVDVVYGDTYFRKSNSEKLKVQVSSPVRMGGFCCHQSLVMKKALISKFHGFDEKYKILADKDLVCKVIKSKGKIKQVHSPISIFSLEGISSSSFRRYIESYQINRKYMPFCRCAIDLTCNVGQYLLKLIIKP